LDAETVPLTRTQFKKRFQEMFAEHGLPISVPRLEYAFQSPAAQDRLPQRDLPAVFLYHCLDGPVFLVFGEQDGLYGAVKALDGPLGPNERKALIEEAGESAEKYQRKEREKTIGQRIASARKMSEVLENCRAKILALRDQQRAMIQKTLDAVKENMALEVQNQIKRIVESYAETGLHGRPGVLEAEIRNGNIRLSFNFRDLRRSKGEELLARNQKIENQIAILAETHAQQTASFHQLKEQTTALAKDLPHPPSIPLFDLPNAPLTLMPSEEEQGTQKIKAMLEEWRTLAPPSLSLQDLKTKLPESK
jgi:hypothetical protein